MAADQQLQQKTDSPQQTEHPQEIELKLRFHDQDRERLGMLRELAAVRTGKVEHRHLVTTYFDTPDQALAGAGIGLRIRRSGGERIQTVKLAASDGRAGGAAASRSEWEWPVHHDRPDLALIKQTGLSHLLPKGLAKRLEPAFTTDIRRAVTLLSLGPDCLIEAAIDDGTVSAGPRAETIHELELELKSGHIGPLYGLARDVARAVPASISVETKAEIGLRLLTGQRPRPVKAPPLRLPEGITFDQGFRAILHAGIGHLLANQTATLVGDDIDGVHQMRVALRRLRAALVLFGRMVEPVGSARFGVALRDLGRIFGRARDWDVFIDEILVGASTDAASAVDLQVLAEAAAPLREVAHREVRAAIGSVDYTDLVLDLSAWAENGEWRRHVPERTAKAFDRPLVATTGKLLRRRARVVMKRGRAIAERSPADLHALRKAVKKLRYAAEFTASLYPKKSVASTLRPIEPLQAVLGKLNDGAMAATLAGELRAVTGTELEPALAVVSIWADRQIKAGRKKLIVGWRKFEKIDPFWDRNQ